MTPEEWRRVKNILDEVLQAPAEKRRQLLEERCAGDANLRHEVEALLSAETPASEVLGGPLRELVAQLGSSSTAAAGSLAGATIGPYHVLALLGTGGMGEVYLAKDTRLRRQVAVKVLHPRLAASGQFDRHLLREARAVAVLSHPNIATVYDVIEDDGRVCIVMEFLQGESLAERLRKPLTAREAFDIATQVAAALEHAHAHGVLHCDLKPANVFVTTAGVSKVLDFGLARGTRPEFADASTETGPEPTSELSALSDATLVRGGTPAYMSPEQRSGGPIDARSDIYSFGLILREMAGTPAGSESAGRFRIERLQPIVERATATDPARRFQSAAEVQHALETAAPLNWPSLAPSRRNLGRWFSIAAMLSLACTVVVWHTRFSQPKATTPGEMRHYLAAEQVTFSSAAQPVTQAALSHEGRVLAYSDALGIWLLDLNTRSATTIPHTAGFRLARWLQDDRGVVAERWLSTESEMEIKAFSLDGTSRTTTLDEAIGMVSPNGELFIECQMLPVSGSPICDGTVRRTSDKIARPFIIRMNYLPWAAWSPESTYVVFTRSHDNRQELWSFDAARGTTHRLFAPETEQPAAPPEFVVLRAGRVLFLPTGGDSGLWQVVVNPSTGEPLRGPDRIADWPLSQLPTTFKASDSGRLMGLVYSSEFDVDVSVLDGAEDRLIESRRITNDDRNDYLVGWTPDSESVLFGSERLPGTLFAQQLRGANLRSIPNVPTPKLEDRVTGDNRWVIHVSAPSKARLQVCRLADGSTQDVVLPPGRWYNPRVSCGLHTCIVGIDAAPPNVPSVYSLDPAHPTLRRLFALPQFSSNVVALSPDASRVAYFVGYTTAEIRVADLSGRTIATLSTPFKSGVNPNDLAWSVRNGLFVVQPQLSEDGDMLYHVDMHGNWHELRKKVSRVLPSPDGRSIAMTVGEQRSNVWLMDLRK